MTRPTPLSNRDVASRIGKSEALVSMMRLGRRLPGMSTMLAIEQNFGWTMQEQASAAERGVFADELNARLVEK